ncbi:hypothetical protein EBB07_14785 [Paenibacillaceae bacterium]|nr:hypothetical protein EBB07_14785 [Paenibacillaceae bacterium]
MPRSSEMPQQAVESQRLEGWKAIVHHYVALNNQADLELDSTPLAAIVMDVDHLVRLDAKYDRMRRREQGRQAALTRIETKARLLRVNESGTEVSALLGADSSRLVQQHGREYTEDRRECERLWLQNQNGNWRIIRIEPVVAERRPRYGASTAEADYLLQDFEFSAADKKPYFPKSLPYINYDILTDFKHRSTENNYYRDRAAVYADLWWDKPNPEYEEFDVNCTNYVSQCLFAGGAPMDYTGKRESGWWYRGRDGGKEWWSYSWAVSNALQAQLRSGGWRGLQAVEVDSADKLDLGDLIFYDWNGEGRFQHSTIVTAFDIQGMPLVNANTVSSRHRFWDYRDSYAWTELTQYRFFHITDRTDLLE